MNLNLNLNKIIFEGKMVGNLSIKLNLILNSDEKVEYYI